MDFDYLKIAEAYAFGCAGALGSNQAALDRESGRVLLWSETDNPDEIPTARDDTGYLALPTRVELHLGKPLVVAFIKTNAPEALAEVCGMFCRKNASVRLKEFLERRGLLERWREHERDHTERALREWCREMGIALRG